MFHHRTNLRLTFLIIQYLSNNASIHNVNIDLCTQLKFKNQLLDINIDQTLVNSFTRIVEL